MKYESTKNHCEALNTLGFLYFHGIEVEHNPNLSLEYFKKASKQNNSNANFACFCLETNIDEKYDYLEKEILKCNPKILTTLGFLIFYNHLDTTIIKNKITAYLYKVGVENDITAALNNIAARLEGNIPFFLSYIFN